MPENFIGFDDWSRNREISLVSTILRTIDKWVLTELRKKQEINLCVEQKVENIAPNKIFGTISPEIAFSFSESWFKSVECAKICSHYRKKYVLCSITSIFLFMLELSFKKQITSLVRCKIERPSNWLLSSVDQHLIELKSAKSHHFFLTVCLNQLWERVHVEARETHTTCRMMWHIRTVTWVSFSLFTRLLQSLCLELVQPSRGSWQVN